MTLYTDLLAAGLPVEWASETQATFSRTLTDAEEEIFHNLLDPTRQIRKTDYQTALAQIKTEYTSALDTLANTANANTLTNAEAIAAIKFHAHILRIVLRLLKFILTG